MTEPNTEIITDGAPNVIPVQRDLKYELAATVALMFRKQREKKDFNAEIDAEIKNLKARAADLIGEIEQGGTQLAMNFATKAPAENDEPQEETDEETNEEEQEH
jgi:MinD-like ATPase involved in chromosome partitioning or flagellar assembly